MEAHTQAGAAHAAQPARKKKNRKDRNRNKFKQEQEQPAGAAARPAAKPRPLPVVSEGVAKPASKKHKRQKRLGAAEAPQLGDGPSTSSRPAEPAQPPRSLTMQGGSKKGKAGGAGAGSLLDRMRQRLQGGRFRWLNEKLYTCEGGEALELMSREPQLFEQYHEGFREQTKGWPTQPVDVAVRWLKQKPPAWVVADLGCGDAKLAASVAQRVHSFDLVANAPGVVACNMADLPLEDASLDAAVFCLSLMGTDYGAFLQEAARALRPGGWLWIAEVQSRFVDEEGRSVLDPFLAALEALGFEARQQDLKNPYFLTLQLQKRRQQQQQPAAAAAGRAKAGKGPKGQGRPPPEWPELRACQYKKR